ncbi:hypothetical protein DAY19_08430 [Halobacteriovorax vibrionivorans]|uniref:Tle cognate immunity protein 4 C-terminal domain-containing protein n=1 Tax=Halobacteriovorax vibrionivorans TaxID=2152716 RepID=A0ABY0IGJ7_9BACT|nr:MULTISPECIES: hypothetical protein [Halobacteriovorax]RZF21705.1 hypothetical protein DAY19_08430 [Halobacteriovorax vibrionivorans]TGD46172.1 hypothetical protein EP118_13160 [Halobacteriovorax sp. Y22]
MEIELGHIGIILLDHSKTRLSKVIKKIKGSDFNTSKLVKEEIVDILQNQSLETLFLAFDGAIFARNSVYHFVKFGRDAEMKKVRKSSEKFSKNINDFVSLKAEGVKPLRMKKEPTLLKVFNGKKGVLYFLFGNKGKHTYIRQNFKLKRINEPCYDLCVWDSSTSILQIRSAHNTQYYINYFKEALTNSPAPVYDLLEVTEDNFNEFVEGINGKVRSVKGKDPSRTKEYVQKDYMSRADIDIRNVDSYDDDLDGYDILSHGVDFSWNSKQYTIYVSLKKGSFWLRKGDPSEGLLKYLQDVIIELA